MTDTEIATDGGVAEASATESGGVVGKLKSIGQFLVVALPSVFMMLWTLDAALVPGADVFLVALIQVIFLLVFFGYLAWRS